jgi:hypothetical protein
MSAGDQIQPRARTAQLLPRLAKLVLAFVSIAFLGVGLAASSAFAASLKLSISKTTTFSNGVQSFRITQAGTADEAGSVSLFLEKTSPCPATRSDASARADGGSGEMQGEGTGIYAPGPFSVATDVSLNPGSYLFCGYLLNSSGGTAAADAAPLVVTAAQPSPNSKHKKHGKKHHGKKHGKKHHGKKHHG